MINKKKSLKVIKDKRLTSLLLILVITLVAYLFMANSSEKQLLATHQKSNIKTEKIHFLEIYQKIESFYQQKGYYPEPKDISELNKDPRLKYRLISSDIFELQLETGQETLIYHSDINKTNELIEENKRGNTR